MPATPVDQLNLSDFSHRSGKVREIYEITAGQLAMIHTNRISAHDQNVCDIPDKGAILTKLSQFWFEKTRSICPNHFLYAKDNLMVVKQCQPIMIEVVLRAYITGSTRTSLWTHYKNGVRNYCGLDFPDGLVKNQKLPTVVITPTTKSTHDTPISTEDIINQKLCSLDEWNFISQKALELFACASQVAEDRGFILVDTKLEFGRLPDGQIILIDEAFTCDSSRFWRLNTYEERFQAGQDPEGLDKDQIRRYLNEHPAPEPILNRPMLSSSIEIPTELVNRTRETYIAFYQTLTQRTFIPSNQLLTSPETTTKSAFTELDLIRDYLKNRQSPAVAIISGSPSDMEHVGKIQTELNKQNIGNFWITCSAHKETARVLEILQEFDRQVTVDNRKLIIVAVAGLSNALGAVASCNSISPVISCPPLNDQNYLIDVHSSLRNPSKVPVGYIGRPDNLAIHIKKIFQMTDR